MSTLEKYFQDSDYLEEDKPLTTSILEVVVLDTYVYDLE